jgi:N-acetylglucosamine-6-phosphate deacetylase
VLKKNDYAKLENDAGFLLNNFQIRHENKTGANQNIYIAEIDNSNLEDWYDKAYNTLLMVIIANDQIEVSKKIKELKQENKL